METAMVTEKKKEMAIIMVTAMVIIIMAIVIIMVMEIPTAKVTKNPIKKKKKNSIFLSYITLIILKRAYKIYNNVEVLM
ncbi:hypothetical protein CNEO2_40016 [Clostridium neonatale]|nr:hypothetical protein CNEO2_220016 [Clostridium neonatale]CAI3202981.1 hypothetical protein CNEO2_270016 [Clostridium neonatale]CAI3241166.1 hypothetical protein CNEO2_320016 [Clostridium neonatale]CAI3242734.1 hypothetical protein CNEO2_40016 [Clostridium neonatale]CAI3591964.1 hypothetical protein CNEO4_200270 [Clostridium neonatale]